MNKISRKKNASLWTIFPTHQSVSPLRQGGSKHTQSGQFVTEDVSQWYTVQQLLSNKCCNRCSTNVDSVSCDVECWNLPFNMFMKVVEHCWTKIKLSSIPFNKLPAVERLKPIVFRVWCHVVSWRYQHGGRRVGISWVRVRMEFW